MPNKILHVLSRALPADNRSKAGSMRASSRVLAATPIYEPVKLYDGGFRYLMNERAPSLSDVALQEPGFPAAKLAPRICDERLLMRNLSSARDRAGTIPRTVPHKEGTRSRYKPPPHRRRAAVERISLRGTRDNEKDDASGISMCRAHDAPRSEGFVKSNFRKAVAL